MYSYYDNLFTDRKKFLNDLLGFIASKETDDNALEPVTISINAPWGYGKTFFINALEEMAEGKHYILKYNAWECDCDQDVIMSIVNEFRSQMEVRHDALGKFSDDMTAAVLGWCSAILKNLPIKGISIPQLLEDKKKAKEEIQRILDPSSEISGDVSANKHLLSLFHDVMESFRANMETGSHPEMKERYTIVIIDELDRCTPDYAVKVMERMKHFFTVKGYFFIFMLNDEQMGQSLKHMFGDIDTDNYLRRFFSMELSLPEPDYDDFLSSEFPQSTYEGNSSVKAFKAMLKDIPSPISLRTLEKLSSYLKFCMSSDLLPEMTDTERTFASFIIPYTILCKHLHLNTDYDLRDDRWMNYTGKDSNPREPKDTSCLLEHLTIQGRDPSSILIHPAFPAKAPKNRKGSNPIKLITKEEFMYQQERSLAQSQGLEMYLFYRDIELGEMTILEIVYGYYDKPTLGLYLPSVKKLCEAAYDRLCYMKGSSGC